MNPAQSALQGLPVPVRKALYWLVVCFGLALGVLQAMEVEDFGPVTMVQALQVYAFLSPLVGVVAVANAKKRPAPESAQLGEYVEDVDMSDFEPVGDISDVYGQEPWPSEPTPEPAV
jgi:hypothetical protein